jgi:hypothetical protein
MLQWIHLFSFCLAVNLIVSCNSVPDSSSKVPQVSQANLDSVRKIDQVLQPKPNVTYRCIHINDSIRKQLRKDFSAMQLEMIAGLNRIDINRLMHLDSIVVMDAFISDWLLYAPFSDTIPILKEVQKCILISYEIQAFGFYNQGKLVRWGPVSMGKKSSQTPTGFYHTNWKSKLQISTENPEWLLPWYFNIVNASGVSLHQYQLPGYPASHACIRLREQDAFWIYSHADQWKLDQSETRIIQEGTPLIIYGKYAFGEPRPWYALAKNPKANYQDIETLNRVIIPHLSKIIEEQNLIE